MAHKKSIGLPLAILLFSLGTAVAQGNSPAVSRLAGDWRISETVTIAHSAPPVVGPAESVLGAAQSGTRLDRMILLLEPSAAQRKALASKLANQRIGPWLTAAEFAAKYNNSAGDVAAIADWLRSQGFQVAALPAGRGWIEFSGTAGQVEQAFHAPVNLVAGNGVTRAVLAGDIGVPAALRPVIHGLVSLDGALSAAALTVAQPVKGSAAELAAETSSRAAAMTPELVAQLLHLDALHADGTTGKGETIAIAARSNIQSDDIAAFRAAFGLPASAVNVIPDGADPGLTADEAEAAMSVSWAGAAAPDAQIVLVPAATTTATDGIDLSLAAIVDAALAHTVSVGYSACEAALSEAHQAFYDALYRQAAAEGMAVIAAAGDSGAAACHAAGHAAESDARVTTGYGVNALASTQWNTAVGVTALAAAGGSELAAWSPLTAADPAYAGGGGSSTVHAAPASQTAATQAAMTKESAGTGQTSLNAELAAEGLPSGYRLLPDLALPAAMDSGANPGLAFCMSGTKATGGCALMRAGGSSAAAAIFSGIAALVAQKHGAQGNVAPSLYSLSNVSGVFDDVQQGNAQLACAAGSPGCGAKETIGFAALAGFDLATGLGSVNAQALVTKWPRPEASSPDDPVTIQLTVPNPPPNLTFNPQATVTLTASVADPTGAGTPGGSVVFFDTTNGTALSGLVSLSNGTATMSFTGVFPLNANEVIVDYGGDGTYGPANSYSSFDPQGPVNINIAKSSTTLTVAPLTASAAIGATVPVTVTLTVGTPPAGNVPPSGNVTLVVDGLPISPSQPLTTAAGVTSATFQWVVPSNTINPHEISATYLGDANYAQASPAPSVAVTVTKGTTTTSLAVNGTPALGQLTTTWTLTATVVPSGSTPPVTGTVTFYDGGTALGSPVPVSATSSGYAAVLSIPLANNISHSITAVYSGDANWTGSTSGAVPIAAVTLSDYVVLTASNLPISPSSGLPTASPGQAVILAATVTPAVVPSSTAVEQYPTGYVDFYMVNATGNTLLGRTLLVRLGITDVSVANFTTATLPGGQDTLIAYYEGDLYYNPGFSNSLLLGIQDFTITPDASNPETNLDIVQGGSGTVIYDITAEGGFAGEIQVVCAVSSQDLPMTCTASPQQIVPNGTVTFVVQTFDTGATTGANRHRDVWPRAAGGAALALLAFFLLPFGRRVRVFSDRGPRRFMLLLLLLIGLAGAGIGCNSVELAGTSGASGGTPLGVSTLKITASEYVNGPVFSRSVYLTVNVLVKP